ncbi:MAG TPA: glycosyltransferase family 2 protein [Candidatus Nanoarchaeia archaeon]|nr:glycosyltransferase family 2 protein [Candidatus Nanoarchaeia archaeon]
MKPVSIAMIAYNEQHSIGEVLREYCGEVFSKLPEGSEFIVYLDSPTDSTPEIVGNIAKEMQLRIIEGEKNLGYSGAMKAAISMARNDVIFYSDSSGKHIAGDFWKLYGLEGKYDIVTGLRMDRKDPLLRRIVTFGQRVIISALFFIPLYDFNTGFKIIHKNIAEKVLPECRYMKQSFSSELLIRAYKKGFTIKNVPVTFGTRQYKGSGTQYSNLPGIIFRSLKGFIMLRIEMWFKQ